MLDFYWNICIVYYTSIIIKRHYCDLILLYFKLFKCNCKQMHMSMVNGKQICFGLRTIGYLTVIFQVVLWLFILIKFFFCMYFKFLNRQHLMVSNTQHIQIHMYLLIVYKIVKFIKISKTC